MFASRFLFALLLALVLLPLPLPAQQRDWEREDIRVHKIRRVVMESYSPSGTLFTRAANEYDTRGNLVETVGYGTTDDKVLIRWKYKYDAHNSLIEAESDGNTSRA